MGDSSFGGDRDSLRPAKKKAPVNVSNTSTKGKKKTAKDEKSSILDASLTESSGTADKTSSKGDPFSWKTVAALESHIQELEEERDALISQKELMITDYKHKEEMYQKQIDNLQAQKAQMTDKVERVEKIENAIIELFVDMKDRSMENPDAPVNRARELEDLRRSSPLIVLDLLRANLKTLLNFKLDYEKEVRGKTKQEKVEDYNQFELKNKVQELQADLHQTRMLLASTTDKLTLAQSQLSKLAQTSAKTIEELQKDNLQLIEMVRSKEEELSDLKEKCSVQDNEIRTMTIRLARIPQLEAQIQANLMQHQLETQKTQAQSVKTVKDMEARLQKLVKLENDNRELVERLTKADVELQSYKAHINTTKVKTMEQQTQRLESTVERLTQETKTLKYELRRSQTLAEEHIRRNAALKQEYDVLFERVNQERQRRKATEGNKSVDYHRIAEGVPSHVTVYKERLREKDREIQELTNKIRRLVAAEHHKRLMEKGYEIERSRYQKELADLKMTIERRKDMRSTSPYPTELGSMNEQSRGSEPMLSKSSLPPRPWSSASTSNPSQAAQRRGSRPVSADPLGSRYGDSQNLDLMNQSEEIDELRRKNEYLESQLREFDNLKSISVATAKAYEHLLKRTSKQGRPIDDGSDYGESGDDVQRAWSDADFAPTGLDDDGLDPDDRTTILRLSPPKKASANDALSAQSKGKPVKKAPLNVGGSKVGTKVGILL